MKGEIELLRKALKDLNLLDRFLFDEAMADPANMQDVLEIILGHEVMLNTCLKPKRRKGSPLATGESA